MNYLEQFKIDGIWKGEFVYDDRFQRDFFKNPIPFIMRLQHSKENEIFTGICQDDVELGRINISAAIIGVAKNYEIFFVKRYPKTFFIGADGNIANGNEPHPEMRYTAKIRDDNKFSGTWKMERTFRVYNEKLIEVPDTTGHWQMERI